MIKLLKDVGYALTSPEKYRDFMNYKKRNILSYVLILVLFSGIVTFGIPAAEFITDGGFENLLQENIPNFTVSAENGFWVEEPVEIDEYNFLIKANSDMVYEDITDLNGQYGSYEYVIVVDKEQIHMKTPGTQEVTARFEEMPDFSFSKENVMEYTSMMYIVSFWILVLMFLIDYGYYFITAFVVSWGAGVIASFMKLRLGNRKLFKMSVYACTLSYLLSVVQVLIGKTIPNFTFFSLIISTGYLYFAMKEYKENSMEELPPEEFGGREDNL